MNRAAGRRTSLCFVVTDCPGNRDIITAGVPGALIAQGDDRDLTRQLSALTDEQARAG